MSNERLWIEADLVLLSPLHVGTGDYRPDPNIHAIGDDDADGRRHGGARVQTVLRDGSERPYIPGSTLKGALRALAANCLDGGCVEEMFGAPREKRRGEPGNPGGLGVLYIHTAPMVADTVPDTARLPHAAQDGTATYVQARTRIDRVTGAAERHKLFHHELVATGTRFRLRATLTKASREAQTALQDLLAQLASDHGIRLGAGEAQGQGLLRLDPDSLTVTRRSIDLQSGSPCESPVNVELSQRDDPLQAERDLSLTLRCEGLFVSQDSSWEQTTSAEGEPPEPDIVPLRDANGEPMLLPSSLLGALRSRSAWLAANAAEPSTDDRDRVVENQHDVAGLTPTERLFGVSGWRGLVRVAALDAAPGCKEMDVTNVAIDRYTGGSLHRALFTTRAFIQPVFTVRLQVQRRGGYPTANDLALFTGLLNDIAVNGLMLGHGTGKGYGWFKVEGIPDAPCTSDASLPPVDTTRTAPTSELPPPEKWDAIVDGWGEIGARWRRLYDVELLAPYHFVRFNSRIAKPPVASDEISHAAPLPEGRSGTLHLEWRIETPFMVGHKWDHGEDARQFAMEKEGPPVIPGSTLRGMIRSVLEIATFSRSKQVDLGLRFSYRDFSNERYQAVLNSGAKGPAKDGKSSLKAGWLTRDGDDWYLEEACYALLQIEHLLETTSLDVANRETWIMLELSEKQRKLAALENGPEVTFSIRHSRNGDKYAVLGDGPHQGTVVVSGQATSKSARKFNEAVFWDKNDGRTRIPKALFNAFDIGHSERERDTWVPSAPWRYWKERNASDPATRIPVYFIGELNEIRQLGDQDTWSESDPEFHMSLARAMKLQFKRGIDDLFPDEHRQSASVDFADAIFGHVTKLSDEAGETVARRGRVYFSDATLEDSDNRTPQVGSTWKVETVDMVAMSPRPSYWPYYLWLHEDRRGDHAADFDHANKASLSLSGRKRYPVRNGISPIPGPEGGQENVTTRIAVVSAPSEDNILVFRSRLRFHNLHPIELGALLWAITFGARETSHRHSLGRGKPFGYGQTAVHVLKLATDGGSLTDLSSGVTELVEMFEDYMADTDRSGVGNWRSSEQIRSLLALANPLAGEEFIDELVYPDGPGAYQKIKSVANNVPAGEFLHLRKYW